MNPIERKKILDHLIPTTRLSPEEVLLWSAEASKEELALALFIDLCNWYKNHGNYWQTPDFREKIKSFVFIFGWTLEDMKKAQKQGKNLWKGFPLQLKKLIVGVYDELSTS